MFTLAHLSDVHLAPLPRPRLRELLSKRILGYANWLYGRHAFHRRATLDALVEDLTSQKPDHVAVTGDLVNISLPAEFRAADDWLRALGDPTDISVVPGNHDAYVRLDRRVSTGLWQDYMQGDRHGVPVHPRGSSGFPYLRLRGPLGIIGLSTAVPTRPFMATGQLDQTQLDALPGLLRDLRAMDLFRVVLIHHPPLDDATPPHKRLRNTPALTQILTEAGAELVLYGHNHEQALDWLETASGPVPLVGVPSASASLDGHRPLARYNLFRIERNKSRWRCTMAGRGLQDPGGPIVELEEISLSS